ncbi:hypothetical protein LLG46_06440 [bacterium]|nr:hypothetical protein [bacterium]
MNNRERTLAILNYRNYDRMPIVHFGYWPETLTKWADEGHITTEEAQSWADGNDTDKAIAAKLGFDYGWSAKVGCYTDISPTFERKVIEQMPDGSRKVIDSHGVILLEKDGAGSIPMEFDHFLKGRKEWDEHFLPRLQFTPDRVGISDEMKAGLEADNPTEMRGIHVGSLLGMIRNWLGMENMAYLQADDPELYDEIIDTVGELSFKCVEAALKITTAFDFGHFWEDICFKSGPLINPRVFDEKVGPHYKRITDLLAANGIKIVSLDCDGLIDALIPTWINNGVNTMFPMEVGTWNASIKPWREQYGRELRGVGGMDKKVFAYDYAAIDAEIDRLKPLVALGGYIPCPDHRIAPDAKWENVQYYCEKMHKAF